MAKILVIDDAKFTRFMLINVLQKDGHTILEAGDGQEGMERILAENPDLVITDLLMPVMDGIQLLAAMKKKKLTTPVIVMTSNIQESVRQQCLTAGARAFANKPPNPDELLRLVQGILS